MTEARELFYDSTFRHKLGSNKFLIAFNNGVYDLKTQTFQTPIIHGNLSLKIFLKTLRFHQLFMTQIIQKFFMLELVNHILQVMLWEMDSGNQKMVVILGLKFLVEIQKTQQHL